MRYWLHSLSCRVIASEVEYVFPEEDLLALGQQVAEAFASEAQPEEKHYTVSSYNRRPYKRSAKQREREIAAAEQRLRERGVL